METELNNSLSEKDNKQHLLVTPEIQAYLQTTSKWATFLAILGFIGTILMTLCGLLMTVLGGTLSSLTNTPGNPIGTAILPFMGIFYLVIAFLYFLPSLYLFQFSEKTKKAINNNNQELLSIGLGKLKTTFKTLGIMTIVMIGLTIIGYGALIIFIVQSKMAL